MMARRTLYRGRMPQTGSELDCLVAHWDGVPDVTLTLAREGVNTYCVDCRDWPLGGGLRCRPCFTATVVKRRLPRGDDR